MVSFYCFYSAFSHFTSPFLAFFIVPCLIPPYLTLPYFSALDLLHLTLLYCSFPFSLLTLISLTSLYRFLYFRITTYHPNISYLSIVYFTLLNLLFNIYLISFNLSFPHLTSPHPLPLPLIKLLAVSPFLVLPFIYSKFTLPIYLTAYFSPFPPFPNLALPKFPILFFPLTSAFIIDIPFITQPAI